MSVAYNMALTVHKGLQTLRATKQIPQQQVAMEARLARELRNVFGEAAKETLKELERLGHVPSGGSEYKRIVRFIEQAKDTMRERVADQSVEAADYGRRKAASELGRKLEPVTDRARQALREHAFNASETTLNRVTGNIMDSLDQSMKDGLGINDVATRLRDEFSHAETFELRRVARTEVNRAQQTGAMETERELGVEYHEWITAEDERVRDTHFDIHGQIVRVGEPFTNDCIRPGEGPIEEVINCRCRLAPFLVPEGKMAPADRSFFWADELLDVESRS